ncbi:pitrilysin family protein [uncultured Treponema sp.]|uniref:M16 family metallopeptidase n=1 Tax=uncultured Treponema sp. TaxID=162155 RepID=UPI0025E7AB77|nr:pitrilysin family protein [uncultured Treponema sp.]
MFFKLKKSLFLLAFSLTTFAFAQSTNFPGLYRYKLNNGLELFVAENDSVPLVYIEIAVRAGAVTQTPENAGLFHLYEHMMFKGNDRYENQDAFTEGANEMGQIDQNGSTGTDRVNYFFTIPSNLVREGLEFWSYAVRTPKLDEQELENEKSVVLAEINADFTNPAHIRSAALLRTMFPASPWRVDVSGSPEVIQNASVETLRQIQKKYYIPKNSAIFVGGNVNHDEVYGYVKDIYSDWENPAEETAFESPEGKFPLSADKKLVFVNSANSDSMIQIGYYLRGPDGETDAADTYSADVWNSISNNPKGIFAKTFVSESALCIPESDYVGTSYPTRRISGLIGFYAAMLNNESSEPEAVESNHSFGDFAVVKTENLNPVEKSEKFLSVLKKRAIPAMLDKDKFFADMGVARVIQQLEDSRIYELESAKSILSSLSFFWSTCGSDYFFSYDKNIAGVKEDDVVSFIQKYIQNKNGTLLVSVSPGIWEKYKKAFYEYGYEEITAENAFWHKSYIPVDNSK